MASRNGEHLAQKARAGARVARGAALILLVEFGCVGAGRHSGASASVEPISPPLAPLASVPAEPASSRDEQVGERLRVGENLDMVVVEGDLASGAPSPVTAKLLERALRQGLPVLVVEPEKTVDSEESGRGPKTLNFGLTSDQLGMIWEAYRGLAEGGLSSSNLPELGASLELDTQGGAYRLRSVELGLPGRRVWIVHQPAEEDAKTMRIEVRGAW